MLPSFFSDFFSRLKPNISGVDVYPVLSEQKRRNSMLVQTFCSEIEKNIYLWRQKRTVNFRVRLGWGLIVCSFFAEQLITYSFSIGSRAKKLIKLQDFLNPNFLNLILVFKKILYLKNRSTFMSWSWTDLKQTTNRTCCCWDDGAFFVITSGSLVELSDMQVETVSFEPT